MSAHDQLERQLRASVAEADSRRPAFRLPARLWSRGPSALLVAASTAVALSVAVVALVAFHHGRPPSSHPAAPAMTHDRSRFGPRPRDPGPIPRNVDDAAVAAAWNTAWREDPRCNPGPGTARGSGVSYGTPSAAMLSTIPALRAPPRAADRLPVSFYVHGRLRPFLFRSGEAYARFIRRARVTDGITVYLVPTAKLGQPPLSPTAANRCYQLTVAALRAELPTVPPAKRAATRRYGDAEFALGRYNLETSSIHEGVFLITTQADASRTDGGQSPSTIRQTGMLSEGGQVTEASPIVMDGIVPGDVATVTLQFPAIHHGSQRLPALNATGAVINNVFVIPVPTLFQRGGWPATAIWRSASGQIVKTTNEGPFHP
jgi:hypothetical protein